MSRRAKRESRLDRRSRFREEKQVHLVVCEGETEKGYFDSLHRHPDVRVHTVRTRKAKHPQREAVVATAARASGDEYTRVWAVFDTDGADVRDLVARARKNGVEPVPSTPTFETWLILHIDDHRSPLLSGDKAEKRLKALMPRWSKGATDFADFADGLDHACARAGRLPEGHDPCTSVHLLIRAVLRGG
ncbi:RloB family protein [Nocardiopsis changdeensis]|uniref:RloB domain-containing protein n=1 Tax=Nocardiopsis changdeensis TaxID=2831969 RepID=A0ABX8BSJ1_9ACTN|nr:MULTISPECIES: RloB family protein [Nocardiopsis]QUX23348.1 RloB domain-containing protein [Nocardiopsis changdeensis]QYX39290.1 RloB family protein [Nocardiopsis sp. MT53]